MAFKEVAIEELQFNPFTKIGKGWLLVTAGDENGHNTMTASWGGVGIMWNKNVATIYIRPQRYTKEFIDQNEKLTLSFYNETYRDALTVCGRVSGRDCDKEKQAGLTPVYVEGTTAFEEADMIFVCKKQYHQEMRPDCFFDSEVEAKNYPNKDYHVMYIVEIEKVLVKE